MLIPCSIEFRVKLHCRKASFATSTPTSTAARGCRSTPPRPRQITRLGEDSVVVWIVESFGKGILCQDGALVKTPCLFASSNARVCLVHVFRSISLHQQ